MSNTIDVTARFVGTEVYLASQQRGTRRYLSWSSGFEDLGDNRVWGTWGPNADTKVTVVHSGGKYYLKQGDLYMSWSTGFTELDEGRKYAVWSPKMDTPIVIHQDPKSGKCVLRNENPGFSQISWSSQLDETRKWAVWTYKNDTDFIPSKGELEIISIDYSNLDSTQKPLSAYEDSYTNSTSILQGHEFVFRYKEVRATKFSFSTAVALEMVVSGSFGVPLVGEGSVTVSASTSHTITNEETQEESIEREYRFPTNAPPHKRIIGNATVWQGTVDADYVATVRYRGSRETWTVSGTYHGVNVSKVVTEVREVDV